MAGLGQTGAGVMCEFSPDRAAQAERLAPGQVVVIRGVCKGEFAGWPVLSDCVVERASLRPLGTCLFWGQSP
jgi:hypothetical protein